MLTLFSPQISESFCAFFAVLPIGSTEAERSFSCLRQIHNWIRSTMTEKRLGNLGVLGLYGFDSHINMDAICTTFTRKNPRRMCDYSLLLSDD